MEKRYKPNHYIYQAVFCNTGEAIEVNFPDLDGVFTFGQTTEEAIKMAQDALEQYLLACEDLGVKPSAASEIGSLQAKQNETIFLIEA